MSGEIGRFNKNRLTFGARMYGSQSDRSWMFWKTNSQLVPDQCSQPIAESADQGILVGGAPPSQNTIEQQGDRCANIEAASFVLFFSFNWLG